MSWSSLPLARRLLLRRVYFATILLPLGAQIAASSGYQELSNGTCRNIVNRKNVLVISEVRSLCRGFYMSSIEAHPTSFTGKYRNSRMPCFQ